MNITAINGTYFKQINKSAIERKNIFKSQGDFFVRTTSFTGKENLKDDKTYNEFLKWANDTDFLNRLKDKNNAFGKILGSGFEGTTYEIPQTNNWVLKQYKRGNIILKSTEKPVCFESKDISPNLNIGQSIARIEIPVGNRYTEIYNILKKQSGKSIGVAYSNAENINEKNVKIHTESLRTLSKAPQSTFNKCIKDISEITNIGYEIDCGNPNNFMFDEIKNQINFVDINDKRDKNQYGEVLYALIGGKFAINFENSEYDKTTKEEVQKLTEEIIKKYNTAMINNNKKYSNGMFFDEILNLPRYNSLFNNKKLM